MIIAGTGSRSLHNDLAAQNLVSGFLEGFLECAKEDHSDLWVMSGMAEGFDELLAHTALDLGIRLWCAIPTPHYGSYYWGEKSLSGTDRHAEFKEILKRAERVTYVCDRLYIRGRHANFVRNDFMVEHGDEFLVYNPASRGTKQCFGTILQSGKHYTIVEV